MRQGNGTDLLGVNDPRSASIGVIYVSPTDDRKSVLAAIITQEKLGRKQVAVVLPNPNKAFQRPVDFDDLKMMRRKLQTQIIFITPSGPGPAEFARQRRFTVYSSLESYAKALRDEGQINGGGEPKKSWFFGSARSKPVDIAPVDEDAFTDDEELSQPASLPPLPSNFMASHLSEQFDEDEDDPLPPNTVDAAVKGGPAILSPHFGRNTSLNGDFHGSMLDEDDEDALPPLDSTPIIPSGTNSTPSESQPSTTDAMANPPDQAASANNRGPGVIDLRPVRRITAKLPAMPPTGPDPQTVNSPPSRSSRSGNAAAMSTSATAGTAIGSTPPRAAGSSNPPVQRSNMGHGSSSPRRRKSRSWLVAAILILLIVAGSVFAIRTYPNALGKMLPSFAQPATITITPDNKFVTNSYVVQGVTTGTPDPAQRQVTIRQLTVTQKSDPKTVNTTGHTQTKGSAATGKLTFFNGSTTPFTISSAIPIPGPHGTSVLINTSVTVPAANPPTDGSITVSAHTTTVGAGANFGASAISGNCCAAGNFITVRNFDAFTGGQDPQNYSFVQPTDVNGIANPLKNTLSSQAETTLKAQLRTNEQLAGPVQCQTDVKPDHPIGDQGTNFTTVTVTVTATCQAQAYDQKATTDLVTQLLQSKATTDIGVGYQQVGQTTTQVKVQHGPQNTITLLVNAKGHWVYAFTDAQKQALARLVAGKTMADAQNLLKTQKGISNITIQVNGKNLPTDANQIIVVFQDDTGVQTEDTPTSTGSGSPTPANTPSGTLTPIPTKG